MAANKKVLSLAPLIHTENGVTFVFIWHNEGLTKYLRFFPEEIKRNWIDNCMQYCGMRYPAAVKFTNRQLAEAIRRLPKSDDGRVWLFESFYVAAPAKGVK